ncbi:hypothetical protein AVEN_11009-1 [Araneus ventricosus]|uniref:Uncharacterized protein n=1 Tax=Araneus ventricosus TaxID=182803 RepID=A0A4Y2HG87_ARAVE|nr:hypothetical protein AVEN_11009-1 [Araneus ventricosus]
MVWAAISWFSVGPMITLKGHIKAKDYVNILAIKSIPWYKLCSQMVMVSSKATKPLFTQLTSSRTGFLSTRLNCHISPGHHSHQTSILLNLCGLHCRGKFVIAINRHHRYLSMPPFCRKNGTRFPWQA